MKKYFLIALSLLMLNSLAAQGIKLNPQFGINSSSLSTDPDFAEPMARLGFHVGADVRIGGKVFLEPGLFFYRTGTELLSQDQITGNVLQGQVKMNGIKMPVCIGYNIFDTKLLKLRLSTGLAGTLVLDVNNNLWNLKKEDFSGMAIGARLGIGVDISIITFDLDSEFGLGKLLTSYAGARNNVLSLSAGVKF